MTNTTLPDEVLKSDAMGRVRTPRVRREALLVEFEKSGVSARKFAALVGVNYQTFASWVQARRKARGRGALGGGAGALVGGGGGRWRIRRSGAGGRSGVVDRTAGREPDVGGLSSPVTDGGGTGELNRPTHLRPKYVRRGVLDAVPIVAPLPEAILERSIVAPGLLAQILVSKYCDHLPLYRQEAIYWSRHQVWLPRQTMAEWVGLAAEWLQPIYSLIQQDVFGHGYVQVDEPSGAR